MHRTTRFYFDAIDSAAQALVAVLLDARSSKVWYRFGPLTAQDLFISGLLLEGQIDEVVRKVEAIAGALRHDE